VTSTDAISGTYSAQKTIFVARYLRLRDLQREIEEGLNVMESSDGANSVIAYGKGLDMGRVHDVPDATMPTELSQALSTVRELVTKLAARRQHTTWDTIGRAIGATRQAAYQRFARHIPHDEPHRETGPQQPQGSGCRRARPLPVAPRLAEARLPGLHQVDGGPGLGRLRPAQPLQLGGDHLFESGPVLVMQRRDVHPGQGCRTGRPPRLHGVLGAC
jgi:hypothetical protein